MLTRREFLVAGTAAAGFAATPSGTLAQTPSRHQEMRDAVPPTSPSPVSARPSDNLGGSTINVGGNPRDLQAAINASAQGDALVCPAGVTYNPITLPIRTASGWTCIRSNGTLSAAGTRVSPSNASQMFKVESDASGRAFTVPSGTQGWRIIGMEATHATNADQYGLIDVSGNRVSFERCYVHGRTTQTFMARCFFVLGPDFQIWDSWVSEAQALGQDAQGIFFRNNVRAHVENCEFRGTGENIMLGDQGSQSAYMDFTIKRNHFFKQLSWRRYLAGGSVNPTWDGVNCVIKNNFEIKWAHRVLFEGNILENNWGGQGQDGTALLINAAGQFDASDIMVRSNIIRGAPYAVTINTVQPSPIPVIRCALLNNLALNIGGRFLFINHEAADLWAEHNTCVPQARGNTEFYGGNGPGGSVGIYIDAPGRAPHFTFKNNAIGLATYGVHLPGFASATTNALLDQWLPDRSWSGNALYDKDAGSPNQTGFVYYRSAAAARIDTATGTLKPGSPLINAASDGKDIGVDFAALNAAQQGSISAQRSSWKASPVRPAVSLLPRASLTRVDRG